MHAAAAAAVSGLHGVTEQPRPWSLAGFGSTSREGAELAAALARAAELERQCAELRDAATRKDAVLAKSRWVRLGLVAVGVVQACWVQGAPSRGTLARAFARPACAPCHRHPPSRHTPRKTDVVYNSPSAPRCSHLV